MSVWCSTWNAAKTTNRGEEVPSGKIDGMRVKSQVKTAWQEEEEKKEVRDRVRHNVIERRLCHVLQSVFCCCFELDV